MPVLADVCALPCRCHDVGELPDLKQHPRTCKTEVVESVLNPHQRCGYSDLPFARIHTFECTSLWGALETGFKHDAKLFPCRHAHTKNAWVHAGAALYHFSYANPLKKA